MKDSQNERAKQRAELTDRDKPTANQQLPVISSQSEGVGKIVLGIVKYFYDRPSQPIAISFFAVSCRGSHRKDAQRMWLDRCECL